MRSLFKWIHSKVVWLWCISAITLACDNTKEVIWDDTTEAMQIKDYYTDEDGNEGIVVLNSDDQILVLSLDEMILSWGPLGLEINSDVTSSTIAISMQYAMLAYGVDNFPAQAWCNAKNKRGQSGIGSWHLPTASEWKYVYWMYAGGNLNDYIAQLGGTPLSEYVYYWTCDEYDANRAKCISPMDSIPADKDLWIKSNKYRVRAVKYAKYKK